MTSPRLPLTALIAATALASLTGCSPEPAVPTAPPAATAEPLFASDEEALAAAEAAYARYLSVFDAVFAEGGENAERLEEVAIGEVLSGDLERAERFRADGLIQVGESKVLESSLQQHVSGPAGGAEVSIYTCMDSFSISVFDSAGALAGNPDRAPTVTIVNTFMTRADGSLLLSDSELWEDGESCNL